MVIITYLNILLFISVTIFLTCVFHILIYIRISQIAEQHQFLFRLLFSKTTDTKKILSHLDSKRLESNLRESS
jgi:hypothetical protein